MSFFKVFYKRYHKLNVLALTWRFRAKKFIKSVIKYSISNTSIQKSNVFLSEVQARIKVSINL